MSGGLLVLDGPDASGKSTLARALVERHGALVLHQTYRWRDRMPLYHEAVLRRALRTARDQLVVLDRWWPSELCYAAAYRGGTRWPLYWRALDRLALTHGARYVIALPRDRERHRAEFERGRSGRPELYRDVTPVVAEYERWWNERFTLWRHAERYDLHNWPPESAGIARAADRFARSARAWRALQLPALLDPRQRVAVGHAATAQVVLLVNETGTGRRDGPTWPCHGGALGALLDSALELINVPNDVLMIANLATVDARELLEALFRSLPGRARRLPPMIALGEMAHTSVSRNPFGHEIAATVAWPVERAVRDLARDLHRALAPLLGSPASLREVFA